MNDLSMGKISFDRATVRNQPNRFIDDEKLLIFIENGDLYAQHPPFFLKGIVTQYDNVVFFKDKGRKRLDPMIDSAELIVDSPF